MPATQLPLKDIHIPPAISWWPPAIGWWLLAALLIVLGTAGYFLRRRQQRKTALKTARKLLLHLKQDTTLAPQEKLSELSTLIRRVAISTHPRAAIASLTGQQWLQFLDNSVPGAPFSQGIGQVLADGHYRPQLSTDLDMAALISLCESWLKQQKIRL